MYLRSLALGKEMIPYDSGADAPCMLHHWQQALRWHYHGRFSISMQYPPPTPLIQLSELLNKNPAETGFFKTGIKFSHQDIVKILQ